ncbi:hypothetical protein [Streptomyces spectabilis]|uniref:Uncharacterized protein n=1 Tax=Streptomyces spectabilis TaxID=68270 RepID=A0A516REA6_STRST|nr:hypothetical protein [Streptomyces spectabilis]QDQ13975.1 hypothetical protein FH965_28210 [Streptomyces spectabilis]
MLALRLARGAHPLVLLRRLLVAAAAAGTGFLLLCALGYALGHPDSSGGAARLAWCVLPLAATVYFAVAVARGDPGTKPRPGLSSVGLGPGRLMVVSAMTTAVACTLGSMVALLFFLHLRGDLTGLPFDGAAAELLAADRPLPLAAALTLLALAPFAASVAVALTLRPRRTKPGAEPPDPDAPPPAPGGLPWGVALLAAGLAVETYASGADAAPGLQMPGGIDGSPAGVLTGWALTAIGLALAGPGLTHLCGRLLQAVRPGALRLLAGRVLMREARRIGQPLGVVCAVASGAYALTALHAAGGRADVGPLTTLGALLVAGCTVLTLATAAAEARHARASTQAALVRLGAPASLLRGSAALRTGVLAATFGPLTWLVAQLSAMPLTH